VRDPLAPILFALHRLTEKVAPDDALRPTIDRANRSVARITDLVNDLLAFARAGGNVDPGACTEVVAVASAALDDVRPRAAAQHVELLLNARREDPLVVACPPGVLSSLLSNLVNNAIKYIGVSSERLVEISVERRVSSVRVEVRDTGPGLPPGTEERVWEPYVRFDRSGQAGLGLGLATVKRLANAYGGAVGVRSDTGGCTFWFELPAAD
jgi:signal transduction histidine kinase